jgi:hypothetical protein
MLPALWGSMRLRFTVCSCEPGRPRPGSPTTNVATSLLHAHDQRRLAAQSWCMLAEPTRLVNPSHAPRACTTISPSPLAPRRWRLRTPACMRDLPLGQGTLSGHHASERAHTLRASNRLRCDACASTPPPPRVIPHTQRLFASISCAHSRQRSVSPRRAITCSASAVFASFFPLLHCRRASA